MKFGIERFSKMNPKNRKILIIGDMLELGQYKIEEHQKLAALINLANIDIVLTIGDAMLYLYKKLNKDYKYKAHFSNIETLKKNFESIVKKNDIVFIKGSRKMKLEEVYN
jgi:UDP-N-acetylmuramoyl-tripeptide--D-alanyl-D-alanine ligase